MFVFVNLKGGVQIFDIKFFSQPPPKKNFKKIKKSGFVRFWAILSSFDSRKDFAKIFDGDPGIAA